ncbi:MAG: hypothetical protein AAF607_07330 [Pseudomonadota bacterium]
MRDRLAKAVEPGILLTALLGALGIAIAAKFMAFALPPVWFAYAACALCAISCAVGLRLMRRPAAPADVPPQLLALYDVLAEVTQRLDQGEADLRAGQHAFKQLHIELAEHAAKSAEAFKHSSAEQNQHLRDMTAVLTDIPQALDGVERLTQSLEEIDVAKIGQQASALEDQVERLGDAADAVVERADETQASSLRLEEIIEGAAQNSARHVDALHGAEETLRASTQQFEAAYQQHGALTEKMTGAYSQIGALHSDMKTLQGNAQAALKSGLKGVIGATRMLQSAEQRCADTAGQMEQVSRTLHDHSVRLLDEVANGFAASVEQAGQVLDDKSGRALEDLTLGFAASVEQFEEAWRHGLAKLQQAGNDTLAGVGEGFERTQHAYAAFIGKAQHALSGHEDVLQQGRDAAQKFADGINAIAAESETATRGFASRLQRQAELLDGLSGLTHPARETLAALSQVDVAPLGAAIESVEACAQRLNAISLTDHGPAMAAVDEKLVNLAAETAEGRVSLSHLTTQIEVSEDRIKQEVSDAYAPLLNQVSALNAGLDDIRARQDNADIKSDIAAAASAMIEAFEQHVTELLSQHRQLQIEQVQTRKTLKSQVRQSEQDTCAHLANVASDIKHIRANQLQVLKQTLRQLPEAVKDVVHSELAAQALAQKVDIDAAVEALRVMPETDVPETVDLEDAAPAAEPDAIMRDVSTRLADALAQMEAIETEATGLAAAALTAPENAQDSEALQCALRDAERTISAWGEKLSNISTAIALARDAA